MVSEGAAADRPGVAAGFVVDADEELADGHSVGEGDGSPVARELAIHDETGDQSFMDGAHVADGVPDEIFIPLDLDFFVESGHFAVVFTLKTPPPLMGGSGRGGGPGRTFHLVSEVTLTLTLSPQGRGEEGF